MTINTNAIEQKTICFAYYGDGKFLGWYADTLGSLRPNSPKLYGNSQRQIDVITKNFKGKIAKLKTDYQLSNPNELFQSVNDSLNSDNLLLSQYGKIELRVVECPYYDGENPNFDIQDYREWLKTAIKGDNYHTDSWIYADYTKVKEWASTEPTDFLFTIEPEP